ncbi:thioesterase [Oceanisphaera profunda]|uniref:Thioesterase n=1 Tax=Oceanisphaera profunda TaxID=1416627 RepID=A0A1Y0D3T0_9GAMM|nr:thioesterase family protein [Oceanisphaera profunda]ART82159.1 thioesterase [Oceanisphaera profunda]
MAANDRDFPVSLKIPVAWGDMDALQHVNNVVYFRYFETIRIEYFQRIGLMTLLASEQVMPVVAETSARYRRSVIFPDTLLVEAKVSEVGECGFSMSYQVTSLQQGEVTTQGSARVVMLDKSTGKKKALTAELKRQIVQLEHLPTES